MTPPDEVSYDVCLLNDAGLEDSSSLTCSVMCRELPDFFKCFEGHKKSFLFTFD